MVELLLQVVDKNTALLVRLVNERVLKEIKQNGYVDRPFFDALIFNKNQETRETIEKILTHVTNTLFDSEDDEYDLQ